MVKAYRTSTGFCGIVDDPMNGLVGGLQTVLSADAFFNTHRHGRDIVAIYHLPTTTAAEHRRLTARPADAVLLEDMTLPLPADGTFWVELGEPPAGAGAADSPHRASCFVPSLLLPCHLPAVRASERKERSGHFASCEALLAGRLFACRCLRVSSSSGADVPWILPWWREGRWVVVVCVGLVRARGLWLLRVDCFHWLGGARLLQFVLLVWPSALPYSPRVVSRWAVCWLLALSGC